MADIVTSRVFTDGERGITAAKLNDIIGSSVIQPAFYTNKPTAGTADPADIALILKAGAYAQVPISALAGSATQAQIWSTRLRSYNAVQNPNFEVDQRNVGGVQVNPPTSSFIQDRWRLGKVGTMAVNVNQQAAGSTNVVPGTSFQVSSACLQVSLTTAQASLGASDNLNLVTTVEGPAMRELINDVHSLSLLVSSSVIGLKFGVAIRDVATTKSLTKLCTLGAAGTVTLIQLPNLPIWAAGGNWSTLTGITGYEIRITLAAGSTVTSPANDTWQNGAFVGAVGQDNFANNPVNSTFFLRFIQHEPGAVCSTLMDKPFSQNLDECLRYYQKSYEYNTAINTVTDDNCIYAPVPASNLQTGVMKVNFLKPLAKKPVNLNAYSTHGGVNAAWDFSTGANKTVSALSGYSDKGFAQVIISAASTAGAVLAYHYVADTGW